jgi:hypothetical protein
VPLPERTGHSTGHDKDNHNKALEGNAGKKRIKTGNSELINKRV